FPEACVPASPRLGRGTPCRFSWLAACKVALPTAISSSSLWQYSSVRASSASASATPASSSRLVLTSPFISSSLIVSPPVTSAPTQRPRLFRRWYGGVGGQRNRSEERRVGA